MNTILSFALTASVALLQFAQPSSSAAEPKPEAQRFPTSKGDLLLYPVQHATFVLTWDGKTVFVDPVGGGARFEAFQKPDLVLITDIHGDHLNAETLQAVVTPLTRIVAPKAVIGRLPQGLAAQASPLANAESKTVAGISIEAVPMYNQTEGRLQYHEKGRGNGYVVALGGKRLYISGDTEDIPEMRALKEIDVALICMNLPYTMTPEQAADAVREFKPKVVYPYHYRGSDVDKFKKLVEQTPGIEVRLAKWY